LSVWQNIRQALGQLRLNGCSVALLHASCPRKLAYRIREKCRSLTPFTRMCGFEPNPPSKRNVLCETLSFL